MVCLFLPDRTHGTCTHRHAWPPAEGPNSVFRRHHTFFASPRSNVVEDASLSQWHPRPAHAVDGGWVLKESRGYATELGSDEMLLPTYDPLGGAFQVQFSWTGLVYDRASGSPVVAGSRG